MTQTVDMTGNTLLVDGVVASGTTFGGFNATDILVGATINSTGGDITIAASDTLAAALQEIANVANPS